MRQAIEEGFILDVLANYITYQTYWHIEKTITDDPAYEPGKATAAIARFVTLHEHNLAQKAEIIVEHFRATGRRTRSAGQAKAMVVAQSREHAVRYHRALTKLHQRPRLHRRRRARRLLRKLDASTASAVTEAKLQRLSPSPRPPSVFDTDEYQILVVAEKYQTGFDQPKLYAMYVDKTADGPDRRADPVPAQPDPPGQGRHVRPRLPQRRRGDPGRLRAVLRHDRRPADRPQPALRHPPRPRRVRRAVAPRTRRRSRAAAVGERGRPRPGARGARPRRSTGSRTSTRTSRTGSATPCSGSCAPTRSCRRSCRSPTPSWNGTTCTARRSRRFIKADAGDAPSTSAALVELTHLRHEQQFEGSVTLDATRGEVVTIFAGTGRRNEPDAGAAVGDHRADQRAVRHRLARRPTGCSSTPLADKLVADPTVQVTGGQQLAGELRARLRREVRATALLDQMAAAEEVVYQVPRQPRPPADVLKAYAAADPGQGQDRPPGALPDRRAARSPAGERTPGVQGDAAHPRRQRRGVQAAGDRELKTIAAFANSRDGGTLLIGVADDGTVHGLDCDYATLHKPGKDDRDLFQQHLAQVLINALGETAASSVSVQMHTVDGHDLCRVHVPPSSFPVDAHVVVDRKGQLEKKTAFFVRIGNGTRDITDATERQRYVAQRWGSRAIDSS